MLSAVAARPVAEGGRGFRHLAAAIEDNSASKLFVFDRRQRAPVRLR